MAEFDLDLNQLMDSFSKSEAVKELSGMFEVPDNSIIEQAKQETDNFLDLTNQRVIDAQNEAIRQAQSELTGVSQTTADRQAFAAQQLLSVSEGQLSFLPAFMGGSLLSQSIKTSKMADQESQLRANIAQEVDLQNRSVAFSSSRLDAVNKYLTQATAIAREKNTVTSQALRTVFDVLNLSQAERRAQEAQEFSEKRLGVDIQLSREANEAARERTLIQAAAAEDRALIKADSKVGGQDLIAFAQSRFGLVPNPAMQQPVPPQATSAGQPPPSIARPTTQPTRSQQATPAPPTTQPSTPEPVETIPEGTPNTVVDSSGIRRKWVAPQNEAEINARLEAGEQLVPETISVDVGSTLDNSKILPNMLKNSAHLMSKAGRKSDSEVAANASKELAKFYGAGKLPTTPEEKQKVNQIITDLARAGIVINNLPMGETFTQAKDELNILGAQYDNTK